MKLVVVGNTDSLDKCLVFLDDGEDEEGALEIARGERFRGDIEVVVQLTAHQTDLLDEVIYRLMPYTG